MGIRRNKIFFSEVGVVDKLARLCWRKESDFNSQSERGSMIALVQAMARKTTFLKTFKICDWHLQLVFYISY